MRASLDSCDRMHASTWARPRRAPGPFRRPPPGSRAAPREARLEDLQLQARVQEIVQMVASKPQLLKDSASSVASASIFPDASRVWRTSCA